MANPINHANQSLAATHNKLQPYMLSLFQRLAINYVILSTAVVIIHAVGIRLLWTLLPIPQSTANIIGFGANLLLLLYGWRYLENRNRATALFVLYTLYSRQRRDLKDTIELAENGVLEDDNTLYTQVDLLEEHTNSFLKAVEERGLKAHQSS